MQVAFLQRALTMQFTKDIPLPETLSESRLSSGRLLWAPLPLTSSAVLRPQLPLSHTCSIISRDAAASTPSTPHTPKNIRLGK
jgi:hypothetical protein